MPTVSFERWLLVSVVAAALSVGAGMLPSPARDARVRELTALLTAPGKRSWEERSRAFTELGRIGPAAAAAAPVLIDYLTDASGSRSEATMALVGMGPRATLDPLTKALERDDEQVAASAAAVIAVFGRASARARPALLKALERPKVRQWAEHALNEIDGIEDDIAKGARKPAWIR